MKPIDQLTPAEIVRELAEEGMGYEGDLLFEGDTCYIPHICIAKGETSWTTFRPLTDANGMLMLVEKMRKKGWLWFGQNYEDEADVQHIHRFIGHGTDVVGAADTPGRAVALAALKAIRAEKETQHEA